MRVFGSAGNMGGAILATQLSIVTVCGLVENNNAMGHGGGIASAGKALLMLGQGSVFLGNKAGGSGGCVYAAGDSVTFGELRDCKRAILFSIATLSEISHAKNWSLRTEI